MRNRAIVVAAGVSLAAVLFAIAGAPGSRATPPAPLRLAVLGDSTARASECPGCTDYAHQYAKDVERATGRRVAVDYLGASRDGRLIMLQASQALGNVYADPALRAAIAGADIVLVGLGFNDSAWNRFDDPCEVAPEYPDVHWDQLSDRCSRRVTHELKLTLDILLTQIDQLRAGRPTLLRVVTPYNQVIGDVTDPPSWNSPEAARVSRIGTDLMAAAECELAPFHGGACADAYHALNGADGRTAIQAYLADGTHLNQAGHNRVAQVLAGLGYAPLVP